MFDILRHWKKFYKENELYCGGCYERMKALHFVGCSYEGKPLTKKEVRKKKKVRKLKIVGSSTRYYGSYF